MSSNKRSDLLDALRGYAIVTVVVGHIIPAGIVGQIIYTYHVAFFMLLAGFTAYGRFERPDFFKTKSIQLLLPCLTWVALGYILYEKYKISGPADYVMTWFNGPGYVWFLWALFILQCIVWVIHNALIKLPFIREHRESGLPYIEILAFIIFYLVLDRKYQSLPLPGTLVYVTWYFPFFISGYLIAKHQVKLQMLTKYRWYLFVLSAALYAVLLPYWRFYEGPAWPVDMSDLPRKIKYIADKIFIVGFPLLAMYCSWVLVRGTRKNTVHNVLAYLGRLSLPIYVAHFSFTGLGLAPISLGDGWVKHLSMALFAIVFSILLYRLLRLSPLLALFLYGETRNKIGEHAKLSATPKNSCVMKE